MALQKDWGFDEIDPQLAVHTGFSQGTRLSVKAAGKLRFVCKQAEVKTHGWR